MKTALLMVISLFSGVTIFSSCHSPKSPSNQTDQTGIVGSESTDNSKRVAHSGQGAATVSTDDSLRRYWNAVADSIRNLPSPAERIRVADSILRNGMNLFENNKEIVGLMSLVKGRALRANDQLNEAMATYDSAAAFFMSANDQNAAANCMYEKGLVLLQQKRNEEGLVVLGSAANLIEHLADQDTNYLLSIYNRMAAKYANMQLRDLAYKYAMKCERIFTNPARLSSITQETTYSNLATVYDYVGRYDKAMYYRNKAIKIAEQTNNTTEVYKNEYNLALLMIDIGQYNEAINILRKHLTRFSTLFSKDEGEDKLSGAAELSDLHSLTAQAFVYLKNRDSASNHLHSALTYGKLCYEPQSLDMVILYSSLSDFHKLMTHQWDSVLIYQERMKHSLQSADPTYSWTISTQYNPYCALAYAGLGNRTKAVSLLDQCLRDVQASQDHMDWEKVDDPMTTISTLDMVSSAYEILYGKTGDASYAQTALKCIDQVQAGEHFMFSRTSENNLNKLIDDKVALNLREIGLLYDLYSRKDTTVVERMMLAFEDHKSSMLKKYFQEQQALGILENPLLAEIKSLSVRREALRQAGAYDAPKSSGEKIKYENLNASIDSLTDILDRRILIESSKIENTSQKEFDFAKLVGNDTLIIDYVKTDDAIYAMKIAARGKSFTRIPWSQSMDSVLENFISAIRSGKEDQKVSIRLFDELLVPIVSSKKLPKRLIIIPDENLNNIPFESLITGSQNKNAEYLGDQCTVQYEYCLSFLLNKSEQKKQDDEMLAFAPSYNQLKSATAMQAESATFKNLLMAEPELRSGFGPLKNNADEVNSIHSLFAGKTFTGSNATEESFRSSAGKFGVIHFATHAYADPRDPNLSGILFHLKNSLSMNASENFSQANDSILLTDNILHAYEIQSMNLNADLVVLSACETGIGKFQNGEGTMSLARAFKYANCPNIVTSLWKVDDASTKEIMVSFYENLGNGLGKADALAEAKRSFRKNHPNAAPFYWAPFVLIGDNEPLNLEKKNFFSLWFIVAGVASALLLILIFFRSRQKMNTEVTGIVNN